MKRRILFVDDEANVLEGLRRMLRPMRKEWAMSFAPGGAEALEILASEPFDVIVSDMRMPGMDGAALLTEVMRRHPQIVRIVLSGQSSQESTFKSVGVAHQFLAKPCDAQKLKQTIDHALALRNFLANDALKAVVSQLKSVPSLPTLYTELMEELQHPDASCKRVGEIIAQDPGMSAKILQLVNSAFFGIPRQVTGTVEATGLLGTDTIKALVLTIEVFGQLGAEGIDGFSPESIQQHCTETATLAKQIAVDEKAPKETADAAMMAGFLHDIGKLVLAHNFPDAYGRAHDYMDKTHSCLCDAERNVLGATHAEVGAYLLGLWGLPESIVVAAAFHHFPSRSHDPAFSPLTAVHVANVFLHERDHAGEDGASERLDTDYLEQLGVADRVSVWRENFDNHHSAEAQA
ncbi:MAG: HDOD domain-containing protein [Phycisphaerae bacterium]